MEHAQQFETCTQRPGRRRSNPLRPDRVQLAYAGSGTWAALIVDRRGVGLEFISGTRPEVLLAVRTRWPGLQIQYLPFAVEDQSTNGRHRTNPAGVPARVELAHGGAGQWVAIVLDERGAALEVITGTKAQVLAAIRERWPQLPIRHVPFVAENPAGIPRRAEVTYTGRGEHTAYLLDDQDRELVRIQADSLKELLALLAERYPGLPVRMVPRRNPAGGKAGRKEAAMVTDRALRYRANADPPPGPRICALCGSTRNVEVGHISGHEEDGTPANLAWVCRSCNVRCANTLRRAGIGRLTHQLNPAAEGATTLGGWLSAVMAMRGASDTMPVAKAVEVIRATPPETRSQFAHEIWRLRRQRYGPSGRPDATPF